MEFKTQPANDVGPLAWGIRLESSSASRGFVVLLALPQRARRSAAELPLAVFAAMAGTAAGTGTRAGIEGGTSAHGPIMSQAKVAFWHWPSAELWRGTVLVGLLVAAWFAFVYGGAWYLTSMRTERV